MDVTKNNNAIDTFLTSHVTQRPRLDRILEKASENKLFYVIAGVGYGKTQAVRNYIEQQEDAVVRWVQLTDGDNITARFWDNIIHSVSFDNPDLAHKLRVFGFPDTLARFKQFVGILRTMEYRAVKNYFVLDDFHLIHSKQALTFAERCAYMQIPGNCVIIISRREPEINALPLFAKQQVSIITEDELRFTSEETAEFLKQRDIPFSAKTLPKIMTATKGWIFAIQLFSLVIKRNPANLDFAFETMKQNVFRLMEAEAWEGFPEHIQQLLVKLSLVSNLPLTVLQDSFKGGVILREAPQLASFVWFDSMTGADRVQPLYWEFLKSKQHILSREEIKDAYLKAAEWCSDNDFSIDSFLYLAKAQDYRSMVELLYSYPFRLPYDTCAYFLSVIDSIDPNEEKTDDLYISLLKNFFVPLLLSGMGKYEDAEKKAFEIIAKWEQIDTPIALRILYGAYSNLGYIDIFNCTVSHEYKAPEHFAKSREYFKRCSLPRGKVTGAFFVADVRSLACLVGEGAGLEEVDRFVEAVKQTEIIVEKSHHSMYYGYEDLVLSELDFYKNQPDLAKTHLHKAVLKARERKQYSIEAMALHYLLRISILQGDYPLTREVLRQLRAGLDISDFWSAELLYDLITGFFFSQIGLQNFVSSWIIMDEKEATSEVHIPTRELIVCVKAHIASKQYNQALAVLNNSYPRKPHERFFLGELSLALLKAVAKYHMGDTTGAVDDFRKAYALSFDGLFEMHFVELGRNLRPLTTAVSSQPDNNIPLEWLKAMERKASIYVKKATVIMNAYKGEMRIKDTVALSDRELEVLRDLYHGLSREEIAENRYLSINTVKKILQSIYIKLDANNNIDAIRIALERKLID